MPTGTNMTALRSRIKSGLLREAYRRKLLSEEEYDQLMRQHKAK